MNFVLQPWQLFLVILAGWVNRQQAEAIEYLQTENQILKEKLGTGRMLLTDDQRRRLAVSDQTVGNVLRDHGIEPAPQRKRPTTWATFLKAHWDVLAAIDFKTVEVWTTGGLVTFYLLFVMELKTRRVHFAGCTPQPTTDWMMQMAKNLTDCEGGFLNGKQYLLTSPGTGCCPFDWTSQPDCGLSGILSS